MAKIARLKAENEELRAQVAQLLDEVDRLTPKPTRTVPTKKV